MIDEDEIVIPKYQKGLISKSSAETVTNENNVTAPRYHLDLRELTYSQHGDKGHASLIFLTKVFANKHLLGYWSHSPWGTTRNQEQGWVVINYETLEVVRMHQTRCCGMNEGGFNKWYKSLKELYGKSNFLVDENGDRRWSITRQY